MDELETLVQIGFDEREGKIYLILLKNRSITASKIAEGAGIDRTTTYDILAKLIVRGIISYVIKNNVKYFQATEPKYILNDLKEKQKQFEEILPKLNAFTKTNKEETKVELFKGKEGIKTVLKFILKDKKDYLFVGGAQDICKTMPIFVPQFLRKAHQSKIKGQLICELGFGSNPEDIIGKSEEYRLTSKKFVSTTTKVWGNKTAFFVFDLPYYAILITSKEIADRQRLYFEYLWNISQVPSKGHIRSVLIK